MANNMDFSSDELREVLSLTTSIGRAMDSLSQTADGRNRKLQQELITLKSITSELNSEEDIQTALERLERRKGVILRTNYGVNRNLTSELMDQNVFATKALSLELKRIQITRKVADAASQVGESIKDSIGDLKTQIEQIPLLGGVFSKLIPTDKINSAVDGLTTNFTRGFGTMFKRNLSQGKGFVKSFSGGMSAGFGQLSKTLGPLLSNPYTAAALAALAFMSIGVLAFYKVSAAAKQFREQTGLLTSQTKGLETQIVNVYSKTVALGASMDDVAFAAAMFNTEFSGIEMASEEVLTSMITLNKNFGVGVEEGIKLNKIFQNIGGLSAEQSQILIGTVTSMADLAKVAPSKVIKDMADNSAYAYKYFNGSPEALAKAAVQAAKLGTSIGEAGKVADNLLDFETSITDELEASAILGTNLNLSQARYLAANGKILEAQQSVIDQVANLGDLTKLNTYEQEALAKATGMPMEDLINQQRIRKQFGKLQEKDLATAMQVMKNGGDISKMGKEDLARKTKELILQQKMQSEFDIAANQFSAIGSDLLMKFMPIGQAIMRALGPIMQIVGGLIVGFLKPFMAIINTIFDHISAAFAPISDLMGEGTGLYDIFEKIGSVIGFMVSLISIPLVYGIETVISMFSGVFDIVGGIIKLFTGDFMGGLSQIGDGIISFFRAPFVATFNTVMAYLEGFFTIFESLGQWIHEHLIDPIMNFVGGIGNIVQAVGSIFGGASPTTTSTTPTESVNDGVMQNGNVISTSPEDYLIATKNPAGLAAALGGGGGMDVSALVSKMDEMIQAVSANRDVYMDREKVSSAVVRTNEKSGENRFGLMGA
jgi:hypothetical protein